MYTHWLYKYIPASRAEARGWRIITWALLGDDESGIAGERDYYRAQAGVVCDLKTFLLWKLRNPLHNVFYHVLRWDRAVRFIAVRYVQGRGCLWWYSDPAFTNWLTTGPQFLISLAPFLVQYRGKRIEFMIGWKDQGNLGLALRAANSEMK